MPNPLSQAWAAVNQPVIPQSWISPLQESLEEPQLDQSQLMAQLKGFGSGALQGLRDYITPLNIGAAALPGPKGLGRGGAALMEELPELGAAAKGALQGSGAAMRGMGGGRGAIQGIAAPTRAVRGLEEAMPIANEAIPASFGPAARAGEMVQPRNFADELQQAKQYLQHMTPNMSMGDEAGKMGLGPLLGAGALGGAAMYGLPKVKDAVGSVFQGMQDTMRPFQGAADALHGAMDKARRR